MAGMAFPKLLPLEQADPTASRIQEIPELKPAVYLLRYAKLDPLTSQCETHPNGKFYYSLSEHDKFWFWMFDRIRRHRSLQQTTVHLMNNPSDTA